MDFHQRRKAENVIILCVFIIFITLLIFTIHRYQTYQGYCKLYKSTCEYKLRANGCMCDGKRVEVKVMTTKYPDGREVTTIAPEINLSIVEDINTTYKALQTIP